MKVPETKCPYCEYKLDSATGVRHNYEPLPGDVSVCINCLEVLVFDDTLTLRKPTLDEARDLAKNQVVEKAIETMRTAKRKYYK